jgi:FixJ family two-component response regulator
MPTPRRTVVIVEDDVAMRQATERVLAVRGIAAKAFPTAEAALAGGAALASCLIVDVRLPGISGLELCERIAREGALPPLVFITAHDEPHVHAAARRLGAVSVLVKPFSGRDLADAVANILARRKSRAGHA